MNHEILLYFTINKYKTNGIKRTGASAHFNYHRRDENCHLQNNEIWLELCEKLGLMQIKNKIRRALRKMVENDIGDGREQTKEIVVPPKLKPHSLCKMNQNVVSNVKERRRTGISQSELKQRLSTLDKKSKVMKAFEGNKCSVCLSNYKEILDEDLHVVIPSCGHPLCCKCADYILYSKKKECPQCREKITARSFNLMKFTADLEIETENQRVFL